MMIVIRPWPAGQRRWPSTTRPAPTGRCQHPYAIGLRAGQCFFTDIPGRAQSDHLKAKSLVNTAIALCRPQRRCRTPGRQPDVQRKRARLIEMHLGTATVAEAGRGRHRPFGGRGGGRPLHVPPLGAGFNRAAATVNMGTSTRPSTPTATHPGGPVPPRLTTSAAGWPEKAGDSRRHRRLWKLHLTSPSFRLSLTTTGPSSNWRWATPSGAGRLRPNPQPATAHRQRLTWTGPAPLIELGPLGQARQSHAGLEVDASNPHCGAYGASERRSRPTRRCGRSLPGRHRHRRQDGPRLGRTRGRAVRDG